MSIVIDELEASVLAALPGESPAENPDYLRELAHRLALAANDLDPEQEEAATGAVRPSTVLISVNPIDGISLHGPFASAEDTFSYAEQKRLTEWWTTPLDPPAP